MRLPLRLHFCVRVLLLLILLLCRRSTQGPDVVERSSPLQGVCDVGLEKADDGDFWICCITTLMRPARQRALRLEYWNKSALRWSSTLLFRAQIDALCGDCGLVRHTWCISRKDCRET